MGRWIERSAISWVAVAGLTACGPSVAVSGGANSGGGTEAAGSDTTESQTGGMDPTQTSGVDPEPTTDGLDPGGSDESSSTGGDEAGWLPEARDDFQTYANLYDKVIQRTCTPFNNVCHHTREFPDMAQPDSLFDSIGVPCRATGILCITPGSPQDSALFQRVTGESAGSSMPLASGRLSEAEIGAIACWIETLRDGVVPQVDDVIDYDNCEYATQGE